MDETLVQVTPDVLRHIITSAITAATAPQGAEGGPPSYLNTPMQKATRPEIDSDMNEGGWEFFLGEW